ncbi:MAG: hypothetical protein HYW24_03515 [Candidatus Aenigmarchaeota archaeon]|nr:hypothetical protein [Candidatus Aenigmarchaeota archaeon]
MKRKFLIGIFIIAVVLFLGFDYISGPGILYELNKIFPQNPDISCRIDSDCKLHVYPEWSGCRVCGNCEIYKINDSKVIAINKEWRPFCPYPRPLIACGLCIGGIADSDNKLLTDLSSNVKCIENRCQKVLS